ncbi:unnamed protein product [Diamesa serratosioi]
MVVDLRLSKEQGQPFGFRLIGGADFEIPLTVSRVVENGTADRAGMMEGDVVVRINDLPTINMSHEEAHLALVAAGLNFEMGVLRASNVLLEGSEEPQQQQQQVPISGELQKEQDRIDKIISDAAVTDEEIAELLSGEAEVLKGHGVMGVNFKRMMPKAGVFKQSEVFQVLNDQQLKTKAEVDKEEKMQWTTFLQKPDRVQPRPKNEQVIVNSYKPMIVKQPKPKCAPDYRATPEPEPEPEPVQEEIIEQKQECLYEQQEMHSYVAEVSSQTIVTTETRTEENVTFEQLAADASYEEIIEETINEEQKKEEDEISEVSSAFAEQLANVQTQLMALSHLPKTIQSTLDEITKQLQQLIPPMKVKGKSVEPEMKSEQIIEVAVNEEIESITVNSTHETDVSVQITTTTTVEDIEETIIEEVIDTRPSTDEIEEFDEAQEKLRQLWEHKRENESQKAPMSVNAEPKKTKDDLSSELKEKVIQDRKLKQKKARDSKFRGLQPQERPIHLPGGRKWRGEKDAMNEELIAEIISSQAELIMGTTLGVNFLKYQKPEKDLSFLKNSETYRTIHHLTPKENGIEKRPATVAAEEDILKCASPNPCNQLSS